MTRLSTIVALILAGLLPGCAGHPERALIDPGKYQLYNCRQLAKELQTQRRHAQELKTLYDKAAQGATGRFVARAAYEPGYLTAVGDIELIEGEQRNKNCDLSSAAAPPAR